MRRVGDLAAMLLVVVAFAAQMFGQTLPAVRYAHIAGTVTDRDRAIVPGATVTLDSDSEAIRSVVANDNGFFEIDKVESGTRYHLTVSAKGFADWHSPPVSLSPGDFYFVPNIKLTALNDAISVRVVATPEEIATEQVRVEESQRILGFIPNFYVSYDQNAAPLTPRLKCELALKVAVDPVTFAGTTFLAADDQAAHYPDYPEGIKGYGQRFGAVYANDLTDIMVGGALLPTILHQDPRYFYEGTGTTRSRLLHALSSPIICRGDNGAREPNYSSIGGYLVSGAVANAYYPEANRGLGVLLRIFAVDFSADAANGVLQEFVLRKLTRAAKGRD